jgi:hypothetical protein
MNTRSRKIMFQGSRAWPVRIADNLAAICLEEDSNTRSLVYGSYAQSLISTNNYVLAFYWNNSVQQDCLFRLIRANETDYKKNSMASVHKRTIPTERPPLVSEVSANFLRVTRGQRDESLRPYSRISRPEPLLLLPSSSSVALTRLSGPRSRRTTFVCSAGNRTRDLRICSQELWPLDHGGGRNWLMPVYIYFVRLLEIWKSCLGLLLEESFILGSGRPLFHLRLFLTFLRPSREITALKQ